MIRTLVYWAVIGFLVVTLAGPIFTLLSFALIGLVVYGVVQAIRLRNPHCARRFSALCHGLWQTAFHTARWMAVQVTEVFRWGFIRGGEGVRMIGRVASEQAQGKVRIAGDVIVETLSGAGVGAMLGAAVYMAQPYFWMDAAIPIGGGIGAFLGLILGISRGKRSLQLTSQQPSERAA